MSRVLTIMIAASACLGLVPGAWASYIVDRNVRHPTLKVNQRGYALVQYTRANGRRRNALFWGAVNGVANNTLGRSQVKFEYDYTGGWIAFHKARYWKRFRDACQAYDGPPLPLFVAGCKAPDGSYWALEEWVRLAPMRGIPPFKPIQRAVELHLSHWTGALPVLQVWPHWTYGGRWQGLFGRVTYNGAPVFGSQKSSFGQYVYIDTFNSVYGPGWKHDAGKALHRRNGGFCYSFVPQRPPADYPNHRLRPPGLGARHRVTVIGPGVTPIVRWEGTRLGAYNSLQDAQLDRVFDQVLRGDRICRKER
jgi:hypothetical protein